MSVNDHLFRYGSVNGKSFVAAIKHNRRETQKVFGAKAHIDINRTSLNYYLHGLESAEKIERYANSRLALHGVKVRKNAVWAVEIIFSLPVNWHEKDTSQFFSDCYQWTLKTFEGELLSFDVHVDESAPHAHALIFPLIDGKMQGDKLKGGMNKIYERQRLFYEQVAVHYGFKMPSRVRLNYQDKASLAKEVIKRLNKDSIQTSAIFSWVRDAIFANPVPCAQLLEIPLPSVEKTPAEAFIEIKRSKGRGSFER